MARGLFDSILTKLENPDSDDAANVSVTMNPLGGVLGAAGGLGPGSVRVSVDVRDAQKEAEEFDSDDDEDDGGTQLMSSSTSLIKSTMPTGMPKTEELLEGVTTDQWNRRKERRAARKRELERLRRQLRESDAEREVLTRALQDLTRNLAQLRFTGEAPDSLASPQFVMEGGLAVKPKAKAQPGIGGAAAAGSRRTSSRASNHSPVGSHADRADSRASLADAAAGARPAGRAPPPTHFNYGPALPPPLQEPDEGGADAPLALSGAVGAMQDAVEVSKEPPNLDEIFDYAAYLGLDTALDNELLWCEILSALLLAKYTCRKCLMDTSLPVGLPRKRCAVLYHLAGPSTRMRKAMSTFTTQSTMFRHMSTRWTRSTRHWRHERRRTNPKLLLGPCVKRFWR